ncbi:MAG: bifunctional phosphopantothenoylcysteine decarboxylase/phosphopantothenate--cysteine ligase CoaBC [Acidobacteriia bacterium]|nr:bifunctional phosphopantothenoylcysteine decarboxylase/phosphopantothenate--cysteine ligase CoaBC [Terriglobia bacterium]MYG04572.1 bifunctional phosphopantothenoylcysteine decarboxylase/phosphopantothenate--cysteine ligase CoaBC [Terriglobia bacterium]MYK09973.1 bifunctional phosphopantothenoylcysteine decarboxylase/phosphopantothenate--cysteine ligase CoaBC [Terriglobia bacterium]
MGDQSTVLLGVTGGIAAYKSAELVRALQADGHAVQAVLTKAATKFITPLTIASLTGNKVITDLFDDSSPDETLHSAIAHIDVAQRADVLLVAPASADMLAKFALGLADDFLSTAHLAFRGPLVLAPSMNTNMWEHPATRENLAALRTRGARIVEPGVGELACGTVGPGRLAELGDIVAAVRSALSSEDDLQDECVLVTAGPTREALDPVRYISNRSSGRMGFELANEAARRGARVVLIAGPVALPTPPGCERIDVESAAEMHQSVLRHLGEASFAVMAAAVADYRPDHAAASKLKKRDGLPQLSLEETPDILQSAAAHQGDRVLVGFAAETDDLEANGRRKLQSKGCDLVVANPVGGATGFDSELNQGMLLAADGSVQRLGPMSKAEMAGRILDEAIRLRKRMAA